MRTPLDLLQENEATVQKHLGRCKNMLMQALKHLQILDPGRGKEEFIPPLRRLSIHLNDEGVPRSYETASSQDPIVRLCLGPCGGPRGGGSFL